MKTIGKLINIGGLFAMALAVSPVFTSQAQAYACAPTYHSVSAVKKMKGIAKIKARKAWEAKMKSQFGISWAVWSIAYNKSIQCKKEGGKNKCTARAKPCQYVTG